MKTLLLASIVSASLVGCIFNSSSSMPGTVVSIETRVPGASPEAVEASVVVPMESAMTKLEGVEEVRSTASEGRGYVEVYFKTREQGRHLYLVQQAVAVVQPTLPPSASDSVVASRETPSLK
jgi:multidrug efflux pump subunit AcrB